MLPLEDNKEKVKSEPKETVAERVELNLPKRKQTETGLKVLTQNKLLTTLLLVKAQKKLIQTN